MRFLYVGLLVVFTALVLHCEFQNPGTATVSLLSASIALSMSLPVFGAPQPD
jgi:hypothetical protein